MRSVIPGSVLPSFDAGHVSIWKKTICHRLKTMVSGTPRGIIRGEYAGYSIWESALEKCQSCAPLHSRTSLVVNINYLQFFSPHCLFNTDQASSDTVSTQLPECSLDVDL